MHIQRRPPAMDYDFAVHMPERPLSHQLEEESRTAFRTLVHPWVFRDKNPDYGIDAEVELFDENGKATGGQFLVQLKAAHKQPNNPSVSLAIDTVKYYHSLELPVLLVLWIKESGKTFWRWANNIDLYYAKPKAKSLAVRLAH